MASGGGGLDIDPSPSDEKGSGTFDGYFFLAVQRIGGAYWIPPRFHSWFMPRGMRSGESAPILRSKTSP